MSLEVCNLVFKRSTRPRLQQKKQGNSQTKQQRTPNKLMRSNKKRQRLRLRLRKRDLNKNLMLPLVLIQS